MMISNFSFYLSEKFRATETTLQHTVMFTYRFFFRPSACRDGNRDGRLYIRLIFRRKIKNIARPYRIFPSEWDAANGRLANFDANGRRGKYLNDVKTGMKRDLQFLQTVSVNFDENRSCLTLEEVATMLDTASDSRMNLHTYVALLRRRTATNGSERRLRAYSVTAEAVRRFSSGRSPLLTEITADNLFALERAMKQNGLKLNTISFYFRNLRAVFNLAVAEGIVEQPAISPFLRVFTGREPTAKRALTIESVSRIRRFFDEHRQRPANRSLTDAAALFLFCFHARGMSFVDAISLKKSNLRDGAIYYYRRKTGRSIRVALSDPVSEMIDYFAERPTGSDYLFPFLATADVFSYRRYETALRQQNRHLQRIATLAGCNCKITTHAARHTWATIARGQDVPISIISQALGHHDEHTTLTYLASIDNSAIDAACAKVNSVIATDPKF